MANKILPDLPAGIDQTKEYPGGYTAVDFYNKIVAMESTYDVVKPEFENCRKNFENYQAPDNIPPGEKFITENLSTDLVRGLEGQLIGGRIMPTFTGLGELEEPLLELHDDIVFRANKFQTRKLEPLANHFYVEGKASIGIDYNPYRETSYGIGVPLIRIYKPHEGLWDNNVSSMHEDDVFRLVRKWTQAADVEKEYGLEAKSLTTQGDTFEQVDKQDDVVKYGNLYSLEYYVKDFELIKPIELDKDDPEYPDALKKANKKEIKTFYIVKIWDRTKVVAESKKTGFSRHTLTPVIHTQRMATTTEPMGVLHLTNQKQLNINVIKSVMYKAVKEEIKNLLVIVGASEKEERKIKREAKKLNGAVALIEPTARVYEVKGRGLATALIQWYEMERRGFDEISGRYGPEKGAVDNALSGKAIIALQNRGTVPELVAKVHLEDSLSEMSMLIMECISKKMNGQPFAIERKIEGKKRKLFFNTPSKSLNAEELEQLRNADPYSVFTVDKDKFGEDIEMINDLRKVDFDKIDLDIKVIMNVIGWEQNEANKALVSFESGIMARLETTKKLYPEEWKAIYESKTDESAGLQLVEQLGELGSEIVPVISKAVGMMVQANESKDPAKAEQLNSGAAQILQKAVESVPDSEAA